MFVLNGATLPDANVVFCQVETELRVAQGEFDRQVEVTKLLLEGIASSHVSWDSTKLLFNF